MGRNGLLGCCFSSGHASSSPGKTSANYGFATDAASSSDSEVHPQVSTSTPAPPPPSAPRASSAGTASSQLHPTTIPSFKLLPLPSHPAFPLHAVGIDDQVKSVIRLLEWEDKANVAVAVILHGFGGTGKTTLADAVVATLDFQGWNCFTVVPFQSTGNVEGGQGEEIHEQAFIYMDSVMLRKEDLEKLLPKSCKKLRLLLTARDDIVADVISGRGIRTKVHPVGPLHSHDALELLCNKMGVAGRMQIPQEQMYQISEILEICDGVPVVLERVGAYICQSRDKDEAYMRVIEWSKDGKPFSNTEEYSIEKKGLLFDLEELPASAKEPFLDICSFFNGWDWDKVSCIMGEDGLNVLRKRALLLKKEEYESKVMVRPIISTISRNMTKGKRLTSARELSKVLEANDQGDIRGIKGIWLQDNIFEPFLMSAKILDLMHNSLRVLALGDMVIVVDGQYCTQQFKQIIYFQAGPIPYIPFQLTALQEQRFLDCRLALNKNDLRLTEMSSKLTMLYLNGGQFEAGSAFGRMPGLRTLKLTQFNTLKVLPEELGLLTLLEELDLGGCIKLVQLPQRLGDLKALRKLCLQCCECLQQLPDCFGKLTSLKYLDLNSCTCLQQLPEDFGSLSSLEELDLGNCSLLKELPSSFAKLSSLKLITLVNCTSLKHLHDDIRDLSAFVRIEFVGSCLVSIPCRLIKLVKNLSLDWCRQLTNLPKRLIELTSLRNLDFYGWSSLERLPEGFGQLKSLAELNMAWCSSLQELSSDFHCLASLQILNLEWCEKLEEKWMESLRQIKTLELVHIVGSPMLERRWTEMAEEGEACHFAVTDEEGLKTWNSVENVENMLNKAASKLFSGECLLTDSRGDPFSLSTVAPNTLLLLLYHYPCRRNISVNYLHKWKLLEEVVKHEHPLPFQMIYVRKCLGELSKGIAERIMAYASVESDAHFFFRKAFNFKVKSSIDSPEFVVTEVVADEGGRRHFSTWKNITGSCVQFLLSKSRELSRLQKLTETSQDSNVELLRALFDSAESRASSIFLRNSVENIGVDQLHGKTVLLFISVDGHSMDDHLFNSLTEIYSKAKSNDDMEMISIPIPAEVRGAHQMTPGSDLAGLESMLRKVPWPVLRNPWLLKTEVYYFLIGEYWGHWNPTILVVVDPNGRILNKNAVPLVKRWGAEVYPFTDEKMKRLERQPRPRQPRQPRVDEPRAEIPIPWAPIPFTLSDLDSSRGGFRVDAPVDLRGTSGSSMVLPVWGCESELDPDDLSTQTALIIPGRPPRYF